MPQENPPLLEVTDFLSRLERGDIESPSAEDVQLYLQKLEKAKETSRTSGNLSMRIGLDSVIERLEMRLQSLLAVTKAPAIPNELELDEDTLEFLKNLPENDRNWYIEQRTKGRTDEEILNELMGTA